MSGLEQRIECSSGKQLARITQDGIKFWCERHRREELRTWKELEALRGSLAEAQRAIIAPATISQ